VQAVN